MSSETVKTTGITGKVEAINDTVADLIAEGKIEQARAAYEKIQALSGAVASKLEGAANIQNAPKAEKISAPSVIIAPGETERRIISLEEAKQTLEGRVFGADQMQKAFGYAPKDIPGIPGSTREFQNAAALGRSLYLRAPLTMMDIHDKVKEVNVRKPRGATRKALYSGEDENHWHKGRSFTTEKPEIHWALTSGEPVAGTFAKTCLEDTDLLIAELHKEFKGLELPKIYTDALAEYQQKRPEIEAILYTDPAKASLMFKKLLITKLVYGTPGEILSDININQENGGSLLSSFYTKTSARVGSGNLVVVGLAVPAGADVDWWGPDDRLDDVGASSSRRLS